MYEFIEITDRNGWKRLVNTRNITDVIGSRIYINCDTDNQQLYIDCRESYEQIRRMIWR